MKTIHTFDDGLRLILVSAREMEGLEAAVQIAYDDEESTPEDFQDVGASLYKDLVETPARTRPAFPPKGWDVVETGGGCTALAKTVNGVEMFVTQAGEASHPYRPEQRAVLGLYPTGDNGTAYLQGEDLLTVEGSAAAVLAIGDRFGFVDGTEGSAAAVLAIGDRFGFVDGTIPDQTPFFAFPSCGSFFGVQRSGSPAGGYRAMNSLLYCPMFADGTPDKENIGEVENVEGINFDDLNAVFGTHFESAMFPGGR